MLAWWYSFGVMSCPPAPLIRGYQRLPPIGGFYVPSSKNFDAVALNSNPQLAIFAQNNYLCICKK